LAGLGTPLNFNRADLVYLLFWFIRYNRGEKVYPVNQR
jgi:hypothetical protein